MTRRPLQALFQRSVLGQSGGIGVEDVEHPWIERLHDAQRVGRDCFIVLPSGFAAASVRLRLAPLLPPAAKARSHPARANEQTSMET